MEGYITKGIGGFYYVRTQTGIVECKARGIFRKRGITPVAGDNVVLSADGSAIDEIKPRRNVFVRPPVANLDVLFIVASTTQPVPSTLRLPSHTIISAPAMLRAWYRGCMVPSHRWAATARRS